MEGVFIFFPVWPVLNNTVHNLLRFNVIKDVKCNVFVIFLVLLGRMQIRDEFVKKLYVDISFASAPAIVIFCVEIDNLDLF